MPTFDQGHALVVGVGKYEQSEYDVPITYNDAKGVYDALVDQHICGYPSGQVSFLYDDTATSTNILEELQALASRAKKDDSVLIFLAGHGAPADDGTWHFATHETEFSSITKVKSGNGLNQADLLSALRAISAQKILVLVNACFSGLVSPVLAATTPKSPTLGTAPPDEFSSELLGTGEGRVIITASRGDQQSYFDPGAPRTFFGNGVVDGLNGNGVTSKNGYIGVFELYEFIYATAKAGATKYDALQEPVLTVLQGVGPFPVALFRGATPGDLGAAGFMTEPPPNTAAKVIAIGAGAAVANVSGSDNTVIQQTRRQDVRGRNVAIIGDNVSASQIAVGENIQQTSTHGANVSELARAFEQIYRQVDARAADPIVDKSEIKTQVKLIEAEAAKGSDANPGRLELLLTNLKNMAPDILDFTASTLINPIAGVAKAIGLIAQKVRDAS